MADKVYAPADIVILSPHGTNSLANRITSEPWSQRVRPFDPRRVPTAKGSGAIQYTSVWAFKGLEAPVVILTDFDGEDLPDYANPFHLFYAGASRALYKCAW